MRNFKLKNTFALFMILLTTPSCGRSHYQEKHEADPNCVYVCTGKSSKRYHSVEDCKGLSKCNSYIVEMTIEEAEDEGKTPCKMCVER